MPVASSSVQPTPEESSILLRFCMPAVLLQMNAIADAEESKRFMLLPTTIPLSLMATA
jgi:hypothetical protein